MKSVKIISTLSVVAAAMWMLVGTQSASQAQSIGVIGNERLSPTVKLTIKANGWLDYGVAQGTEYFGTPSWNCTASFKQLVFSEDPDGTERVDAMAQGTFYDTVHYVSAKANVTSHFIRHPDGSTEARVTIANAKTGVLLYTNEANPQLPPLMLAGGLMSITMP